MTDDLPREDAAWAAPMLDRGGPLAGVVLWEFRPIGGGSRTGLRLLLGPSVEITAE